VADNENLDDHGQPINRLLSAKRIKDRAVDEVLGICKGCLADGVVNQEEAEFLLGWIDANAHALDVWPINVLHDRLHEYLRHGKLDSQECAELFDLLKSITGVPTAKATAENLSTSLPFDFPFPVIEFPGNLFCFTGKFVTGTREACIQQVCNVGGGVTRTVCFTTRYLVVGEIGSRDWIHSSYGRKIEEAVRLRTEGHLLSIVPEQHWAEEIIKLQAG
jgi:hypothetical protein